MGWSIGSAFNAAGNTSGGRDRNHVTAEESRSSCRISCFLGRASIDIVTADQPDRQFWNRSHVLVPGLAAVKQAPTCLHRRQFPFIANSEAARRAITNDQTEAR